MTKINVRVVTPSYNSRVRSGKKTINVSSKSGIIMARKLADLMDVDVSNVQDNFILKYDAIDQKYRAYDPDELLTAAFSDGIPQQIIDYLNNTLNPQALIDAVIQIYDYISNLTIGKLANVKESVDFADDTYVFRYDKSTEKYESVDPDEILLSAIQQPSGLPSQFLNYLNEILIPQKLAELINKLQQTIDTLTLGDLFNVNDTEVLDKYVIMFNAADSLYKAVNPDEVLKATVQETTQEGLPEEFLQQLDDDLDNRIDVDAGTY
jgi:hypothetical protein